MAHPSRHPDWRVLLAVFGGGVVGTGLRLAIGTLSSDGAFPTSTLVINVVGSFALGLLAAASWRWASLTVRAALGPGLLGSFTTFSAVAVGVVGLVEADAPALALAYSAVTLTLGLAAAWLGLRVGGARRAVTERR